MKKNRTFVIGDIHGGYKGLIQVLKQSEFDYDNDILISLGDLADGWSETHLVIEELIKIKNLILLKGNHDVWTLQGFSSLYREDMYIEDRECFNLSDQYYTPNFLKRTGDGVSWYAHGGLSTKKAYENLPREVLYSHFKFLANALTYYIDDDNRLFAHAGPNPALNGIGLKEADEWDFYWNRRFWMLADSGYNVGKYWKEVYIGHTPTIRSTKSIEDNTKPLKRANVWNMDTGACFTGKISLMDIDTKELYQSSILRRLYPDEPGRMGQSYNKERDLLW